ncbi:MAG: PIN domain-containing protein [Hormoscilla sp. GM7CHS1pb]|nr:PIN domain-containing protein [Hormoscilla sp. GM7CHS1pb]
MPPEYRIYLDVCCWNRPFDDFSQERIRLEAEAVLLIYKNFRLGIWMLLSSDIVEAELRKTPDRQRLELLMAALAIAKSKIKLDDTIKKRAAILVELGFKPFDATHIASAEAANADVFLTTDDRLLRNAQRHLGNLRTSVQNPVYWLIAINQNEEGSENEDRY